MVSDSKILTVSYGTFSCTLEGFDDPFNTMRSIAEYFRDLAADDRYFGAEPPTPDPQMLQSIAEREIQRRVETQMQDNGNGMVLRQLSDEEAASPAPAEPAKAAPAPVVDAAPTAPAPQAPAPQTVAPAAAAAASIMPEAPAADVAAQETDEAAPAPRAATSAQATASIAEKLARIRAAVAQRENAPYAEDQHASDSAPAAAVAETVEIEEASYDIDFDEASDEAEDAFDIEALSEVTREDEAPEIDAPAEVAAEIEDVIEVAQADEAEEADVELEDDLDVMDAEDLVEESIEDEDNALDLAEEELEIEEELAQEDVSDADDLSDADINLAADMAEAEGDAELADPEDAIEAQDMADTETADEETADEETANVEAEEEAPAREPIPDPLTRVRARVVKMRRADYEAEIAEQQAMAAEAKAQADTEAEAEIEVDEEPEAQIEDIEGVLRAELGETTLSEDDEADLMRELAEIATDDVENAEEDVQELAQTEAAPAADSDVIGNVAALMAKEDDEPAAAPVIEEQVAEEPVEDDLDRELAALRDEAEAEERAPLVTDAMADAFDRDLASEKGREEPIAAFEDVVEEDGELSEDEVAHNIFGTSADDTIGRILDETEKEMEKGDGPRRRSAIAHLKAAVMAKRADKSEASPEEIEASEEERYRADLKSMVTPEHADKQAAAKRNLPPLMLVSEQRIDGDVQAPAGADLSPVRPRRVAAKGGTERATPTLPQADVIIEAPEASAPVQPKRPLLQDAASDFAEYVESVGAQGLTEVLEAAAAYANFVEGNETVSRPRIMRLAAEAMAEEPPLEERLRSFGQLLREGKIQKIERGKFAAAEDTRFKPDARRLG